MKRMLRIALPLVVLLVIAGTVLLCRLTPKKPALEQGTACPPVRTALATIALLEHATARTYATVGPGAAAFTNLLVHAGLAAVTNDAARADLVFVSADGRRGDRPFRKLLAQARARCAPNG